MIDSVIILLYGVLLLLLFSSTILLFGGVQSQMEQKESIDRVGGNVILGFFSFIILFYLTVERAGLVLNREFVRANRRETILRLSLLIIFSLANLYQFHQVRQRGRQYRWHSITKNSIKESLDNLPSGLLFAEVGGKVLLSNHRMNHLGFSITGKGIQDANAFWEIIEQNENHEMRLVDGSVWSFTKQILPGEQFDILQISATDITKNHELAEQIHHKNEELQILQGRLKEYQKDVEELTKAKERLGAKIQIHNDLGGAILSTRQLILSETSNSEEGVKKKWEYILDFLENGEVTKLRTHQIAEIFEAAKQMDVEISLKGEFPREKRYYEFFYDLLSESLINAVKHSGAKHLTAQIIRDDETYEFVIENDGALPMKTIQETGGLLALRRRTEQQGGQMEISVPEVFRLYVKLPIHHELGEEGE